ncbi:Uma2 family endonuclease [Candidatus Magnetomonas plexicatena]|uniref:Uma2 family endonuclease n=1 Tax=Candidatus Magnetomonas plexicatena TaxID=2552947 RepID=UPI001C74C7A8|nr:Uma2 family endonuclease [Nitrospirales bacterium LBB_01]
MSVHILKIMQTLERDFDLTEIIEGEEIMGPSPFGRHQMIISNLNYIIQHYVKAKPIGHVYFAPLDVIFEEEINRLQPDILFIRKENMSIFQDWVRGVPDMICEVVSPGTYVRDTAVKRAIYEKYRVPEYWIVIPELSAIEILIIENNKYKTHSFAEIEGVVTSKVIDGLEVNIKEVFE